MPLISYGTMPSERGQRRAGGFTTARSMRLVAMVLFSSAALITLLALARGPTTQSSRRWLLQTQLLLHASPVFPPPRTAATESALAEPTSEAAHVEKATQEEGSLPTEKDVASFIAKVTFIEKFLLASLDLCDPEILFLFIIHTAINCHREIVF